MACRNCQPLVKSILASYCNDHSLVLDLVFFVPFHNSRVDEGRASMRSSPSLRYGSPQNHRHCYVKQVLPPSPGSEDRFMRSPTLSYTRSSWPYPTCICPKTTSWGRTLATSFANDGQPDSPMPRSSRWPQGGPCARRMSVFDGTNPFQTSFPPGYWNADRPCWGVSGEPKMLVVRPSSPNAMLVDVFCN